MGLKKRKKTTVEKKRIKTQIMKMNQEMILTKMTIEVSLLNCDCGYLQPSATANSKPFIYT
jgi:hypothetical protein